MQQFKGTPGPWKVKHSESKTAFNVIGTVLGGKHKIVRCPYIVSSSETLTEREMNESESNARLIAAAPELFDALQGTIELLEDNGWHNETVLAARAAISKALGTQS